MTIRDITPTAYLVELIKVTKHEFININMALGFFQYASYGVEPEFKSVSIFMYSFHFNGYTIFLKRFYSK